MNNILKYAAFGIASFALAALVQSCAMDDPFGSGEGTLNVIAEMNGETIKTRAVPENNDYLRENCVIYIENSRGVMRKYKGVDNIPSDIVLSTGNYVCNAWSGDSVGASFSSKFYRGQEHFEITRNQRTSLRLKCNIANVVVSVDPESLNIGLSDLKVKFSMTAGELDFDDTNIRSDKGYFMTPSPETQGADAAAYAEKTKMTITISGTQEDGSPYSKQHVLNNVQRAHEYTVQLSKEERPFDQGGALIALTIKDIPIIEDTINVFAGPTVQGVGFDINEQVVNTTSSFSDVTVSILGYQGLKSVIMNVSDNFTDINNGSNIIDPIVISQLSAKGINVESTTSVDSETGVDVEELYVTFSADFLNNLPASVHEYRVSFTCTDERDVTSTGSVGFANTESAITKIDDIVVDPAPDTSRSPMAITGTTATLTGRVFKEDAADYGIKYRAQGTSNWTSVSAKAASAKPTRAQGADYSVTIKGLTPGTTYEYIAYADNFESPTVQSFTTESKFILPNWSLEEWGTYKASTMLGTKTVIFPGSGDAPSFWDSGNEGGATANKVLTDKSTDMVHSGTFSARLASTSALGMLAAGNLFVGDYVKTDGTNGVLSFGREYNSSHPTKLRVWANYRPGVVDIMKDNGLPIVSGEKDHGQIYVALTVGAVDIRTNPSNQKLFSADDDQVIGYGQVSWTDNFGPDGSLQMVEIPIEYNNRAKSARPTHIVIVCCASKYGDYFSGSSSSVMYVDDFELVYE